MVEGGLTQIDGVEFYRVDGVEEMDPFLMSVVSSSDLWMFASSRGSLTAGRADADHALLPYETDDRIHRAVGIAGPVTIVAREGATGRELWRPFGAEDPGPVRRSVAKSTLGDRLVYEETHEQWGLRFRATWAASAEYGWVRRVQLTNTGAAPATVEVLDGLIDVMPPGVDAQTEQVRSNLVDAYKRSETGAWGSVAIYTLESLITDRAEPAESLAANIIWSSGGTLDEVHVDERIIRAMVEGRPRVSKSLLTGRRGAYLLRGEVALDPGESTDWTIVADVGLDHVQVLERIEMATSPDAIELIDQDVAAGSEKLRALLASADGFQETGDAIADAHHLSNVLYNSMRGGLFPHALGIPVSSLAEHVKAWNRNVYDRHAEAFTGLGGWVDPETLRSFAAEQGDPLLTRLVLEFLPLSYSRRHGDPSRPWNRFAIRVRGDDGEEILGYEGNWRDIFQNWEALMFSHPGFLLNAVAKFVNASTADGHNPYRISQDGIDWEVPDPEDPWSNIGYWGDHQIVYLLRLLESWSRFDPDGIRAWLHQPVFVYADVPYRLAGYAQMLVDPRNTITYDTDCEERVQGRVDRIGADGRLVVDATGQIVKVGLLEKLLVPLLAKLSSFVPGGGIWMNTQRPEWNDANNALAGYGLSMVTLYHLYGYVGWLRELLEGHGQGKVDVTAPVATWIGDLLVALEKAPAIDAVGDEESRRALLDALGEAGSRHRTATAEVYDSTLVPIDAADIHRLLAVTHDHLALSTASGRRPDGLYDSYNLVSFPSETVAQVRKLGPMLEGQVAVLSSGALDARETLDVLEALYSSEMYRADQDSFMLYPAVPLAPYLERNTISPEDAAEGAFLERLVGSALVKGARGGLHFTPEMINEEALRAVLATTDLDDGERQYVLDLYEGVFGHHAYTGRSGSMYGYEGLGSIYWHMVGKLLLAVQESYWRAIDRGEPPHLAAALADAYRKVRSGLGFCKDPGLFGAIPTDCYSHTPAHAGAQQPGMTGQVKEEVLTRMGELGIRIDQGRIVLAPGLLSPEQMFSPHGARFTYCGLPFLVTKGEVDSVSVRRAGEWGEPAEGLALDRASSRSVFGRSGSVEAVHFTVRPHV